MLRLKTIFLALIMMTGFAEAATYRYNGRDDLIGKLQYHRIQRNDSWESIAYYYDVGYLELRAANPQISSLSRARGKVLLIPTQHLLPEKHYAKAS